MALDWTDGYVSDIAYTTGFYRELAPSFLTYAAQVQGRHGPDPSKPFAYAELGCGQGFGTNILAACYPQGRFVGVDFNPGQVANARGLAAEAQLDNVDFRNESFREAADLPDGTLPAFDYVALHGIYTWITEANRRAIVRFIDRFLKPGGLVYVSYNCMPGWAAMAPFQRLLLEHAERNPDRSDRQVAAGMEFVQTMRDAEFAYFTQNPLVPRRIDAMRDKDRHYLAHEYLNGTWQPMFFTDIARELSAAKLEFVASATLLENFETIGLPQKAREALAKVTDPAFRELLKDYAINQQFRRDVFIKGARTMTPLATQLVLIDMPFAPLVPREAMSFTFKTPVGEATGQAEIYAPIADAVAVGRTTIREVAATTGLDMPRLTQAFAALTHSGQIHPVGPSVDPAPARRLNRAVARRSLLGEPYRYLAAPTIANGINAGDLDIAAVDVLARDPMADADGLAHGIWDLFQPVNRRLMRDGKALQDPAETVAELRVRTGEMVGARCEIWRTLGLVE